MKHDIDTFYAVINSAREFMNQMNAVVSELHRELGVNSGSRGVLLLLKQNGQMTSPQLAREMAVSRQYLQKTVSQMKSCHWLRVRQNPNHKKSDFIELTATGKATLEALLKAESELYESIHPLPDSDAMGVTAAVLGQLTERFRSAG